MRLSGRSEPFWRQFRYLYKNTFAMTPNIDTPLMSEEAQFASFRDFVRQKAIAHKSCITYEDPQGRWVEEWPVTGEIYELSLNEKGERTRVRRLN